MTGRKRTILVDTCGYLLKAHVHAANLSDKVGAIRLLALLISATVAFPRLTKVWADSAYAGVKDLMKDLLGWTLEIVSRPPQSKGFVLLPRRWVVERTFAWMGRNRRLSKDYEVLPETEEAFLCAAMVRMMLRRLTSPA